MYLKTLTLKGFKSFLERTRLSFDPGLSVVVGPNGSGKSNISDAILWVLGEQSAKTLRGQAMEDVIFAGSTQRHAVGVAEVTLVLDNADHALPLDFEEVAVTRRMYRSGESEYLLNGAQVRLRDIRDLLFDMGLGRDTYSIISQGRLGEVLQSRPEDRRALIEEAAGIAKHRQRKERAERKLRRLEEDVGRIRDYVRLLKRELRPLERQVDQARAMERLQRRRAELETALAVEDLRELRVRWSDVERRRTEAAADVELTTYRLGEKERELAHLKGLLEEKGLFVGDLEGQRHRSQQILGGASGALRLLDEKGRHLVDRLSDTRRQLAGLEHEAEEVSSESAACLGELGEVEAEGDAATARLGRLEAEEARARRRSDETRRALDAARERVRAAQRRVDESVLAQSRLSQELANADVADGLYADRIAELELGVERARGDLSAARETLAELEGREGELRSALEEGRVARERLQAEARDARGARSRAERDLAAAWAEAEGLERLLAETREEDPLQARLARASSRAERLVDCLVVPEGLEGAVATYLENDLLAFVPGGGREVRILVDAALDQLDGAGTGGSHRAPGHATLLDGDLVGRSGDRECPVTASSEAARPLVEALFRGFHRVAGVDEGLRLVASGTARGALGEDGSVVLADGRVRLGAPPALAGEAIDRARRLKALERGLPGLEAAFGEAVERLGETEAALSVARDGEASLASELSALEAERDGTSREVGRAQEVLERSSGERDRLEVERREARRKTEGHRERLAALEAERELAEAELAEATETVPALEEEARRARGDLDGLRDQLGAQRLATLRLEERKGALERRASSLRRRSETLASQRSGFADSARALEVLARRVEPLHRLVDALHEVALRKARLLQDRSSVAEADSASLKGTVREVEDEVARARERQGSARSALASAEADGRLIELQVRQAVDRVRELGATDLETALAGEPVADRRATERELERTVGQIEAMGPVNMVALTQYEEGRERLESVQAELDDLTGAREALAKVSSAIDRKMRRRFLETFDAVNVQFADVFRTLFGGGDARLEMTDPAHPAQTGVEIRVQPPGKRVAKMTLLSGGEQSLTALALLFAVYRTRTVPFYVFDEVEQALDDRNLNKLLSSLDTLKRQTQLIVISHQRRTMEQADVLYGVSMGADGVSRAVSQRLADFRRTADTTAEE